MGDVALTLPVIKGLLENNPDLHITFVSRKVYRPFFEGLPRFTYQACDFRFRHKGMGGLLTLYSQLRKSGRYDYVIDLHDVIRTWILNSLFRSAGHKVFKLDKGRRQKRLLTRGKIFHRLKSTYQRYLDPFMKIGLLFKDPEVPVISIPPEERRKADEFLIQHHVKRTTVKIGIAPFTLHKLKTWPLEYVLQLIQLLERNKELAIFLFGGGDEEIRRMEFMEKDFRSCISVGRRLNLATELALMEKLDAMITMDSANMHMAALVGIPTVALWGGTHPFAGFEAYGQVPERNIQISKEKLVCRPCTVYGAGVCKRGDFACMRWLEPDYVYKRLVKLRVIPPVDP